MFMHPIAELQNAQNIEIPDIINQCHPSKFNLKKKHEQKLIKLQPQYGLCFSTYSTFILFFFPQEILTVLIELILYISC